MMVPNTGFNQAPAPPLAAETGFNWMNNTAAAGPIYASKYPMAVSYQNAQVSMCGAGNLAPMTEQQLEEEALGWYAALVGPLKKPNPYYVPNQTCTGWMVTTTNADLVKYVNAVLQGCAMRNYLSCQ
jgi:hypothetical protein